MFHIIQFRLYFLENGMAGIFFRDHGDLILWKRKQAHLGKLTPLLVVELFSSFLAIIIFGPLWCLSDFMWFFFCFFPHLDAKVALIFSYGYILERFFYDLFKRIATFGGRLETGRSF